MPYYNRQGYMPAAPNNPMVTMMARLGQMIGGALEDINQKKEDERLKAEEEEKGQVAFNKFQDLLKGGPKLDLIGGIQPNFGINPELGKVMHFLPNQGQGLLPAGNIGVRPKGIQEVKQPIPTQPSELPLEVAERAIDALYQSGVMDTDQAGYARQVAKLRIQKADDEFARTEKDKQKIAEKSEIRQRQEQFQELMDSLNKEDYDSLSWIKATVTRDIKQLKDRKVEKAKTEDSYVEMTIKDLVKESKASPKNRIEFARKLDEGIVDISLLDERTKAKPIKTSDWNLVEQYTKANLEDKDDKIIKIKRRKIIENRPLMAHIKAMMEAKTKQVMRQYNDPDIATQETQAWLDQYLPGFTPIDFKDY